MSHPDPTHNPKNVRVADYEHAPRASKKSAHKALVHKLKKTRTIVGHWGNEPIHRPKTLAERHPDWFKKK